VLIFISPLTSKLALELLFLQVRKESTITTGIVLCKRFSLLRGSTSLPPFPKTFHAVFCLFSQSHFYLNQGFVYQVPVVLEIQLVAGNTSTWDYSEASGERPDIYPADWQLIVRNINYYAIFPIVFLLVACLGGLWFFICGGLFMVKRRVRKNNIFARYGLKGQNAKQKCTPIFSKCEVLANPIQDPPKTQANGRSSNYSHPRSEVDRSSAVPEVGVRRAIKHASQGSFSNRWQGILHDVAARATPLRDQELDVMANKALRDNASILGLRARRMRDEIPIPEDVIRFVLCNDKSVRGIVLSAKS
jgi:hypothetical protein